VYLVREKAKSPSGTNAGPITLTSNSLSLRPAKELALRAR